MEPRCLVLFTKPAVAGRVKTRLIGHLTAAQAARLHAALLDDARDALRGGGFELRIAWALEDGEPLPGGGPEAALRQGPGDLGQRLFEALRAASERAERVAAAGSDRPGLDATTVRRAFEMLDEAELVIEPALDGGYSLIALRAGALRAELFVGVEWSTPRVLAQTLARAARLGLRAELLPPAPDLDTPADLASLCERLAAGEPAAGPRTRELLAAWGRLAAVANA